MLATDKLHNNSYPCNLHVSKLLCVLCIHVHVHVENIDVHVNFVT